MARPIAEQWSLDLIISDRHKFAFVHIPKCAGTSVRNALRDLNDPSLKRMFFDHETLGKLHFTHLPLWLLREHFPDIFDRLCAYTSFAYTRDPMERFGSAVMQHSREFLGYASADITSTILVDTAAETIRFLTAHPKSTDHRFVHFTPQIDFVELDGECIVDNIDPVGDFSRLNHFLSDHGLNTIKETTRDNATVEPGSESLKSILNNLRPIYRKLLPPKVKTAIWLKLIDAGVYRPRVDGYAPLRQNKEIASFVYDFYGQDFELFERVSTASKESRHTLSQP